MAKRRQTASASPSKKEGLGHEVLKAALLAVLSGALGYAGGLIMPPGALYDRYFRQDPNNLTGKWVGAVGGWAATLELAELPGRQLKGTLKIKYGNKESRTIQVEGNHDFYVVLNGDWDSSSVLKIGLVRKVGDRFGPDTNLVLLAQNDPKVFASMLCPNNSLNVAKDCGPIGDGSAYFSRSADQ